jgi:hypothetical protein
MASDTMTRRIAEGRVRKADRLATTLRTLGATADDVAHFTDDDRRMAEASAAVRRGSDDTWRLVTEMLAGSAAPLALCPTCGLGDPEG